MSFDIQIGCKGTKKKLHTQEKRKKDLHKLGVNPALTQARTKRRVKIASLLENMDEDVDYEEVEAPALESGDPNEQE